MDTARFLQLRELFDQAIGLPPAEREKFLGRLGNDDPEMAIELRGLLSAHNQAGSIQPPAQPTSSMPSAADPIPVPQHIGRYRILRRMGGGGMGDVYQAVRDDGAFRKHVALKLIRAELLQDKSIIERFQAERQVLAALEHPYVARILDGGDSENGSPYYVMELVDGKQLDEYCDEKKLDVEKRLQLFRQICDAVHYLHNHQVVHRDLKPSNIFVTHEGIPKLLDFGIAKILGPVAPDLSALHGSPLTPSYASPEQFLGRNVTALSDVFTLGVILYQLLSGKLPDRLKTLPPSVAVSNEKSRMPESETQLRRKISGDLDKIVLRAMEPDPPDRYRSAEELSADIGRYLDHRTVLASKASATQKVSKFLTRNRLGVAVAMLILILGGAAGWFAFRNYRLQSAMTSISQTTEQLKVPVSGQNVDSILRDLQQLRESLKNPLLQDDTLPPEQMKVRKAILDRSVTYLGGLEAITHANQRLAKEVAEAYIQVAELQQSEQKPKLADKPAATASYTAAARQYLRIVTVEPQNQDVRQRLSNVEQRLTRLEAQVPAEVLAVLRPAAVVETPEVAAPPTSARPSSKVQKAAAIPVPVPQAAVVTAPTVAAATMPRELEDLSMDAKTKVDTAGQYYLRRKAELEAQGLSPRADAVSTYSQMNARLDQARRHAEAGRFEDCEAALRAAREYARRIQELF